MTSVLLDRAALSATLVRLLSRELKIPEAEVGTDLPLTQFGLDSIGALMIAGELEEQLELELPSTLLWDCPTVTALANYLHGALHSRHLDNASV